ncbi:hypothetical protein H6769_03760 [Candidatus Peribacteria bacterium]|nr:hypothetical protein [Candidatus Peribacteria bacterium]
MNSDNTPLSEKQKKQKEKNLKRIALEQAKNDEVNAKMESFRVEPIPSEIEHIQENKMYKTIKIASEKVEMLLNEKKMPSPQELVEFHKIM